MKYLNPKPKIRPIRLSDIQSFNNGENYPHSLRGVAVELDGEAIGIAGVLHSNPPQVFSEMNDKMRKYPIVMMKVGRALKKVMSNYSSDLYAVASEDELNSDTFLTRLGFEFIGENDSGRYYKWLR